MVQDSVSNENTEKREGFFTGRNIASIGCLLLIIFVIALIVVIFFGGALFSNPRDEGISPGP